LGGAVVFPGTELPLNVFEPRYLNMVFDVLGSHRMFGMVQPRSDSEGDPVPVYETGCAGRITSFRETNDGRIILVLSGVSRFDIERELPTTRGYRLSVPRWDRFRVDYEEDTPPLGADSTFLNTLREYLQIKELDADWDSLKKAPSNRLVNTLSTVLPMENTDKQALIEAISVADRLELMEGLFKMSSSGHDSVRRH
jgi:Lon protease-like protein